MPGQLIELFDSRTEQWGASQSAEFAYIAKGCADEVEVRTLAEANVPGTYNGLYCLTIEIQSRINADTWKVIARYGVPQPYQEDTPQPTISFDTTGGTQHITQSLATVASARTGGGTVPNLNGAIGYDGENVNGVDITVPVYNWQETHYLSNAQLNEPAYYALTGSVNSDVFRGFQPGEVLFLGVTGQKRLGPNPLWELTFKFSYSGNRFVSVPGVGDLNKKGWEYLWVQYGDTVTANTKVKQPVAAYVEKVYDDAPFSTLGIGS